jgi:hypothetical protein
MQEASWLLRGSAQIGARGESGVAERWFFSFAGGNELDVMSVSKLVARDTASPVSSSDSSISFGK